MDLPSAVLKADVPSNTSRKRWLHTLFVKAYNQDSSLNFSFRCHRDTPTANQREPINVYSVNAISFHPQYGTFTTAGSDGTFNFWDKDSKHRLKGCGPGGVGGTISCTAFSRSGQIFAYAVSYDWSKVPCLSVMI